jgi:hypothetical protein
MKPLAPVTSTLKDDRLAEELGTSARTSQRPEQEPSVAAVADVFVDQPLETGGLHKFVRAAPDENRLVISACVRRS